MKLRHMISLGEGGAIDAARIILVTPYRSRPIHRLLAKTDPAKVVNVTYGYPRESVLLLDSGYIVIASQKAVDLIAALDSANAVEEVTADGTSP